MDTETTLTFWTWVPNIQNEVKLFTTKYPKIKVNVVNVGQGAPHYQKLRTAIQAGQGAPDVAQVEFQFINSFTSVRRNLLDSPHTHRRHEGFCIRAGFGLRSIPTVGLWGIPQDTGPMGLLYRQDLLQAAGIEAPKTYDDFAAAAETYHSKNPKSYLVNVAPSQAGQMVAYLCRPAPDHSVSTANRPSRSIWLATRPRPLSSTGADLVTSGVASNDTDFNDSWYQGLSNGKWAALPIAAWGPCFSRAQPPRPPEVAGHRPATVGIRVRPSPATGVAPPTPVLKLSKNPIAASQLALVHQHGQAISAEDAPTNSSSSRR
jgi:multiple sugar transport system substrate-binding protein